MRNRELETYKGFFDRVETIIKDNKEVLNFHHENISACCRGKISQSNGFHWKYVEI